MIAFEAFKSSRETWWRSILLRRLLFFQGEGCGGVLETTREMWGRDMGVREKCGEGGMGVC